MNMPNNERNSEKYQYSARRALPLKVAYFLKQVLTASINPMWHTILSGAPQCGQCFALSDIIALHSLHLIKAILLVLLFFSI